MTDSDKRKQPAVSRLGDLCCELGEGPHYDGARDTAWWFDILGRQLIEHRFGDGETRIHALPRMASVVAKIDAARQLLAMDDGLYLRRVDGGELSLLAPLEADNPATRSNDGRVHPSGRLWIGTMGRRAEREAGAIYWFDGNETRRLYDRISIPNSICFSPDGALGYFTDTPAGRIWRVALDPGTGLPTGEPETYLTADQLPRGGNFDGSVTDADGVLWNAAFGGGSVSGFAPDGSLVASFDVPAAQATCPCFVGAGLDRLLVTSAYEGYDDAQRQRDPGAGYTYVVDGDFRGAPDAIFALPADSSD